MPKLYLIIVFKLEFGSRAKDKVVSELTEEEKNVKALKRWHEDLSLNWSCINLCPGKRLKLRRGKGRSRKPWTHF